MASSDTRLWSERWRLAALSSEQLTRIGLGAVMVGLIFALYHLLGVSTEDKLFGRSTFLWMFAHWRATGIRFGASGDHSHGVLIPIATLAILWWKRRALLAAPKSVSRTGLAVVVLALFFHWAGARAQLPRLCLMGLVLLTWGIPFYLWGWQVAKILIFPCSYLIFCIPLNFLDSITTPLRLHMTAITHFILNGLGFSIVQSGTALYSVINMNVPAMYLLHPDNLRYSLEIADPCSGIRSLMAMVAITALYGYLTQRTLLKKWIIFLAAVPLAMTGNVVRILTVAIVSEAFGQKFGAGLYHDFAGYLIFMAITIPLMILFGNLLDTDFEEMRHRWKKALLSPTS